MDDISPGGSSLYAERSEVRGQPFLPGATKKRGCRGWRLEDPAHLSREKTGVTW